MSNFTYKGINIIDDGPGQRLIYGRAELFVMVPQSTNSSHKVVVEFVNGHHYEEDSFEIQCLPPSWTTPVFPSRQQSAILAQKFRDAAYIMDRLPEMEAHHVFCSVFEPLSKRLSGGD